MYKLKLNRKSWLTLILPVFALFMMVSCGDDEDDGPGTPMVEAPIASFQFAISDADFLSVTFTNFSQNATAYAWDFGDGSGTSTDESPTYTYAAAGDYTVSLTASNADGESATRTESFTLVNPNSALTLLTGTTSKTWRLNRNGVSMSVGPDAGNPGGFWAGLTNDGSRPCLYEQEFTFGADGSYTFNDNGGFWAEFGVFNNAGCNVNTTQESCFEAIAANMVNECGDDVSAWLSGTHSFTYDPTVGQLTLTGEGAWIGIPKLQTTGEAITPATSVTTMATITEGNGFDEMLVEFIYEGVYWPMRYISYSDASLEPALVTVAAEFGEDLPDVSPTTLTNNFMDVSAATLDTIQSGSTIEYGVTDPADASATCGQFNRTGAQFQELQFQTSPTKNDINFENLSTVTFEVYLPSTNDYSGALSTTVLFGLADRSRTEQWWLDLQQWENMAPINMDEWTTVTFNLSAPDFVNNTDNGNNPFDRNDYDMAYIQIGGGDHTDVGTFFIRNLLID